MDKEFIACLQEFVDQRVGIACDYCNEEDPKYKENSKEEGKLWDKLKTAINPEEFKPLLAFNNAKDECESIFGDRAYLQGLSDGLRLRDHIRQKIAAGGKDVSELYYTDRETRTEVDFSLEPLFLEEGQAS